MKKILAVLLALVMILSLAACGGESGNNNEQGKKKFKVGLICIGDENDQGYTYNFLRGQKEAQKQLAAKGIDAEWHIIYNKVAGAEVGDANRDLVEEGCKIIFNNSFDHAYEIPAIAAENPDVHFVGMTNSNLYNDGLDNTSNAFAAIYQGRYLAGVVAGLKLQEMIDNGEIKADEAVIGYVAAYYYAEVVSGYTAYYLGAKSVCPSVTMITQMVGSWSDATAEGDAAKALIAQGAVMISQHADNTNAATEAEAAGVFHTGYNNDMTKIAPKASLVSTRIDWTKYFVDTVTAAYNGEPIPGDYCGTYADGEIILTELNKDIIAAGTEEKLAEVEKQLADGTLKVFDTSAFTVDGKEVTHQFALDTDGDWVEDSEEAIIDGEFKESYYQSAPYFTLKIDGITRIDE